NYSDFGSATTGKIASRFELTPTVALRGALATGFRAPSLTQSWFSSTATNFTGTPPVAVENKTFPVGTTVASLLGASDLEAETSVNVSYGLTWSPTKTFTLSTDFYRIDVDDRVVLTGNMINATTRALLASNGFSGVGGARYFTNAIDTRTDGLDIVLNYGVALTRNNTLRLGMAYNNNITRVTHVKPTPAALSTLGEALFDRVERVRYERGQPRSNFRFTTDHQWKRFNTVFQVQRVGSLVTAGSATNVFQDQEFTPKWIADANINVDITRQLAVTVGADNLFDVYPDRLIPINSNSGTFAYSGASPFGFNGRFLFVRLSARR
ncbi:MAG: TonB-dependent receptor, partial [Gemmatimonadetes bacterium]|nr:TonB-dependent receptor [Gemmatimonadota bacterium]